MYSVILCGGSGTRLWPLSRRNFPKQFLRLYSEYSLLQETYLRMRKLMPMERILFVTNKEGYPNVLEQIRAIDGTFDAKQVIIEPKSLNTAPAMACAIEYLLSEMGAKEDERVLFLPSDHYIGNVESYLSVLRRAFESVGDHVGTIGISATKPETGYGYIRKGDRQGEYFPVLQFCEKPDRETAERYIASGEYVWNSGMYLLSIGVFLAEAAKYAPEIATVMHDGWERFVERFDTLPSISFDYAVSEKSDRVVVYEGEFGWNDIGSFDSLAEVAGTGPLATARHIGIDSKNVFVHSENDRLVATIGVEDLVVIETSDSILIHQRGRAEDVKKIVEKLRESGAKEVEYDFSQDADIRP